MAYPALDTGRYGAGTPIDISDPKKLWRGSDKTNGFLMRNVDGRVPALKEGFAAAVIGNDNPLIDPYVIPWGNALWVNIANINTQPHTVLAQKPASKAWLQGVLSFEQGWQTGNPVQNYGLPPYSRGTVIRKGYVGYKVALVPGASVDTNVADYLAYLQGDATRDVNTIRSLYADWMAALKAAGDGSRLALFFENTSGFPVVQAVLTTGTLLDDGGDPVGVVPVIPVLTGATFAAFAEVLEPENEAVYFDINL
jgi:hypothetical protein